jgi:hypothetical protein
MARGATLDDLLAKGPVSVVETQPDGRLKRITVYARVDAPVDAVWARLVGFAAYPQWMPQVDSSTVLSQSASTAEVAWSIKVPGPNFKFTARYQMDAATHSVTVTGTAGGLSGGEWEWHLSPMGITVRGDRSAVLHPASAFEKALDPNRKRIPGGNAPFRNPEGQDQTSWLADVPRSAAQVESALAALAATADPSARRISIPGFGALEVDTSNRAGWRVPILKLDPAFRERLRQAARRED